MMSDDRKLVNTLVTICYDNKDARYNAIEFAKIHKSKFWKFNFKSNIKRAENHYRKLVWMSAEHATQTNALRGLEAVVIFNNNYTQHLTLENIEKKKKIDEISFKMNSKYVHV